MGPARRNGAVGRPQGEPVGLKRETLFQRINGFDATLHENAVSSGLCQIMIEAYARRIAEVEGTVKTSVRLQTLADDCAAIDVMPIQFWRQAGKLGRDSISARLRRWLEGKRLFITWFVGFAVGMSIGYGVGMP